MGERAGARRGAALGIRSVTQPPVDLRSVAGAVARDWGIVLGSPYVASRHSFVAPAGEGAVVKVTAPDDDESNEESDALRLWDGRGAVRLLRHDRARRALLLERARPGSDLSGLDEDEATAIAVHVSSQLWQPASAPFRWIGDHVPEWLGRADESHPLVSLARSLYEDLDVGRAVLVHGDLHHHNLLAHGRRWVAIDPKPMLGEREYDIYSFLRNPIAVPMRLGVAERRLAAFAQAGLDEGRMRAWAVIRGSYLCHDAGSLEVLRALV